MAGEWLIQQLKQRGGSDAELAEIVYGTVTSVSPLEVKLGGGLTLPAAFLVKGRAGSMYQQIVDGKVVTIDDRLRVGDSVTLLRHGNGQRFYILDRG